MEWNAMCDELRELGCKDNVIVIHPFGCLCFSKNFNSLKADDCRPTQHAALVRPERHVG